MKIKFLFTSISSDELESASDSASLSEANITLLFFEADSICVCRNILLLGVLKLTFSDRIGVTFTKKELDSIIKPYMKEQDIIHKKIIYDGNRE